MFAHSYNTLTHEDVRRLAFLRTKRIIEYKFLDDAKLFEKPMRVREFTFAIGMYDFSLMTRYAASWEVSRSRLNSV